MRKRRPNEVWKALTEAILAADSRTSFKRMILTPLTFFFLFTELLLFYEFQGFSCPWHEEISGFFLSELTVIAFVECFLQSAIGLSTFREDSACKYSPFIETVRQHFQRRQRPWRNCVCCLRFLTTTATMIWGFFLRFSSCRLPQHLAFGGHRFLFLF